MSGCDGLLKWLHILMLMSGNVIFVTSNESLTYKLENILWPYGMQVNEIKQCESYTFLGAIITSNGFATSLLKVRIAEKKKYLNILHIFLSTSYNSTFFMKRNVFEAAFLSAILYDVNLALGCHWHLWKKCTWQESAVYLVFGWVPKSWHGCSKKNIYCFWVTRGIFSLFSKIWSFFGRKTHFFVIFFDKRKYTNLRSYKNRKYPQNREETRSWQCVGE